MSKAEKSGQKADSDANIKYIVKVKTGSVKNASTDSTVSVTMFGNKIKTDKVPLKVAKTSGPLFQKSRTDEFHIMAKNVGQIKKISVGHDSDGTIKSWFLESVVILANEQSYKFVAKRWLDQEEGDGKTSVELTDEFDNEIRKPEENKDTSNEDTKATQIKKIENPDTSRELKNFRKIELERLKTNLSRESSKIHFPKREEHKPFIFNDLCPYYETNQLENLLSMPQNEVSIDYCNRVTATGIVYPWIAHRMEREVPLSRSKQRNAHSLNQLSHKSAPINQLVRPKKSEIEGSTLTPRFPILGLKKPKGMTGPFYVDDVSQIRKQLRKNFGSDSIARQAEDKTRTVNDFYRMRLDHFHPLSMDHMKQVYHAYLDNTVGSKKALKELLNESDSSQLNNYDANRKSKSAINV